MEAFGGLLYGSPKYLFMGSGERQKFKVGFYKIQNTVCVCVFIICFVFFHGHSEQLLAFPKNPLRTTRFVKSSYLMRCIFRELPAVVTPLVDKVASKSSFFF